MIEEELLNLLQSVRDGGDEAARSELNELLRNHPEARTIVAKALVDEQALLSHLRDESIVSILDKGGESTNSFRSDRPARRPLTWALQMTAGLAVGVLVGVLGAGVVWAMNSTEAVAREFKISHGDFDTLDVGRVPNRFPVRFGEWCGDPAEVVELENGDRELRFLQTSNITGNPNGGASACNVFQLVDLSPLRVQEDPDAQMTLRLSARFRREAAATDAELPKIKANCAIQLFQAEPDSIGRAWPQVIRDSLASGGKRIRLNPGEDAATISASCLLESDANIALISVNVNSLNQTRTPVQLGGFFVDDISLTVIKQPTLPVRFVQ